MTAISPLATQNALTKTSAPLTPATKAIETSSKGSELSPVAHDNDRHQLQVAARNRIAQNAAPEESEPE
jgi:hypothetical protein